MEKEKNISLTPLKKNIYLDTDGNIRKKKSTKELSLKQKCFRGCGALAVTSTAVFYFILFIWYIIYMYRLS